MNVFEYRNMPSFSVELGVGAKQQPISIQIILLILITFDSYINYVKSYICADISYYMVSFIFSQILVSPLYHIVSLTG